MLLAGLTLLYTSERLTPLDGLVVVASSLALAFTWRPLRTRPVLATALLLNVGFILLFFWSLDETHHVMVHVTPSRIAATVDGDTTILNAKPAGSGFGLESAPLGSYRIQATGEAIQSDTGDLFGRVAATFRLAEPSSAWSNIRVSLPNGRRLDPGPLWVVSPSGSWSTNRRGERRGSPDSYALFAPIASSSYTLSADLLRPDGTQAILVGLQGVSHGHALELRFDQPDALWITWSAGNFVTGEGGGRLNHVALIPEIQRVVRTIWTGYLFALLFAAVAIGLYFILLTLFTVTGDDANDEWAHVHRIIGTGRFKWGFFALVGGTGTLATGLVATNLLERIPHVQDDVAYLFQAKMLAGGAFHVPAPPVAIRSFFAQQFMPFYHGEWLSQYPPGHPLLLMLGVLVGAPWLVEPVLASLALGCTYLLGRRLYGNEVGILAALLGLSSPFWLFLGASFMSHATGMFFAVTFMLCFSRAEDDTRNLWPFLAGFLAGMAFITRELTAIGIFTPFALYALLFYRRWRWAFVPAVLGAAIPLGFLLLFNWVQMGNPFRSTYYAWDPNFAIGFGNHVGPLGPFTPADGIWNIYQNLSMLLPQLYGWPYGVALAFAFLPFVLCAARRWDYLLAASFLSVAAVHALYWAPGLMYGPRYYYEALPALFLLTARGVYELFRLPLRVSPHLRLPRDPVLAAFLPVILLSALLVFNLRFYLPAQIPLYQGYNFSSAAELHTVQNAGIHHAIVFVASPDNKWTDYGNVFFANDPRLNGDIIYARDEGPDDSLLFRYFPGRTHYRLEGTTLTRLT